MKDVVSQLDQTLNSLKDFQSATVASVMDSFNAEKSQRVLVADEVGLGKTIVAKGVIAELLKIRLQDQKNSGAIKRLRVTYICSNLTLAAENRKKLAVFKGPDQEKYVQEPTFGRLLETSIKVSCDTSKGKYLEVCSLTPSTSFNLTQGHGNRGERLIIYTALIQHQELEHYEAELSHFLSADVKNWTSDKNEFIKNKELQRKIVIAFHKLLKVNMTPFELEHCGIDGAKYQWLDALLAFCRNELVFKQTAQATRFRTFIRSLLARACAKHLSADLFILDEFQRFKILLDSKDDSDESLIAREIFSHKEGSKILLLSATPFKAVSSIEDDEEGNAHAEELDFLLKFISNSDNKMLADYGNNRKAIQQQVISLRDDSFDIVSLNDANRKAIENVLSPYLCRTERVQISDGYDELFTSSLEQCLDEFTINDIEVFKVLDRLGLGLQEAYKAKRSSQLMEFYKAAPWPLSFLSGYQFKIQLDKHKQHPGVKKPLSQSNTAWLSGKSVQNYHVNLENAPHAKTRALVKRLFKTNSEELLWVPPSMPYYPLSGSFEGQESFSKTLLFSSWAMVPRALSGLISYEAERRLLVNQRKVQKAYHKEKAHSAKIKFDERSNLAGWSLVYPCKSLIDLAVDKRTESLKELLNERVKFYKQELEKFSQFTNGKRANGRWYALTPFLLDYSNGYKKYADEWIEEQFIFIRDKSEHSGRVRQLERINDYLDQNELLELGPMPDDLAEYLAYLSIAGPAVSIARSWQAHWTQESGLDVATSATEVAFAVVAMFNKPESESILRKRYRSSKYFLSVAQYCVDGGFQAVIDEFSHLLYGDNFPLHSRNQQSGVSATDRLIDVMGFRTSSVACQFRENKRQTSHQTKMKAEQSSPKHTLRCHYAVPLGNQKTSDEKGLQRVSSVRDAFNSPFRPFLLNSTSIGQEGLDFHWYCHNVVHWNLPGNPIDIEQREGRVNRYKSLVVRKRLAESYRKDVEFDDTDTWAQLFRKADELTKSSRLSDLEPYWHLPKGSAKIERYVPLIPLSRDVHKLQHALKVLVIYRLAFGQPRQEELLENLLHRDFSKSEIEYIKKQLVINLAPISRLKTDYSPYQGKG